MSGTQRTDEWVRYDEAQLRYHTKQWEEPKESTKAFEIFVRGALERSGSVLDLGSGTAAATAYLAEKNPHLKFTAADYVKDYLEIGEEISRKKSFKNLSFREVDWFRLDEMREFDSVISLQTLSWLPEAREPLRQIFEKIGPKWVALSSLFFEGDISCTIQVAEHTRGKSYYYNIYALPEIERICSAYGYTLKKIEKFEMPFDLEKPENPDLMGTYTRKVVNDDGESTERLQISGPLLMPWYMILIERKSP